jgi:macrolide-specific efflux system membrane fusion protein
MPRRKKGRAVRLATLGAVVALVGGYLWMRESSAATEPAIETTRVRRQTLEREVSATGVIRPMVGAEIEVGSRVSGIVHRIPVAVGDRVERGDLLALINPIELQASLAQSRADLSLARAQLDMAESSHQRAVALAAEGIVSENELESAARDLEVARARVDLERARLSSARITLDYTEIRAPILGVIADVTTREGETVAASFAAPTFVTIVDLDRMEVQAYVDETDIGRVFVGQEATFSVDTYPEIDFSATVTAINPKAEIQNGVVNYVVRMAFESQDDFLLRPEMTTHVRLSVEKREDVLTIPRRAVRRDDGRQLASVLRDGAWVDQPIQVGWRTDRVVEILDGLAEGEPIRLNQE